MKFTTTAHDPEVGAARVGGSGNTPEEAKIQCLTELAKYLQTSVRWVGAGEFKLQTKEN